MRVVFKTSHNEKGFALQQGLANFLFVSFCCLFKGKMVHILEFEGQEVKSKRLSMFLHNVCVCVYVW